MARPESQTLTTTKPQSLASALRARLQSTRLRAYIALAVGVVCIGFSAIFTKWAGVSGTVSAFYRVLIATVVLAIPYALHLYRSRKRTSVVQPPTHSALQNPKSPLTPALLGMTALAGLFFALDLGFWNTSLRFTSAANATLLGNTSTLWVSLGALFIFHESLKKRFWAGMGIALVGAVIVMGRDALEHAQLGWGDLLSIGSSLFYAGYLLTTGRTRRQMGTLPFMWLSSAAATALLLVYVLVMGETLTGFSPDQWYALIALGVISHTIGWLTINYSLGHLPAPLTSVTLLSQPVITAILAVPLLGEELSVFQIGGGLLVLLGVYAVNRR